MLLAALRQGGGLLLQRRMQVHSVLMPS